MKKYRLAICLLLFLALSSNAFAYGESERIDWFFKQRSAGERPEILDGSTVPSEYNALYMGREGDKSVYLTFDAGYCNENVEKILDVLKAHNAHGAFFILPGIIKNNPETVKRMIDEGHTVCNHSYSHGDMSKINDIKSFEAELTQLEEVYTAATGQEMAKFFRPPEGAFSVNMLKYCSELGYTPVFWSFAYADWDNSKQPSAEKAKAKVLNSIHDGMVLLLHPTSKTNALILDDVLTELEKRGYAFGTLEELKSSVIDKS